MKHWVIGAVFLGVLILWGISCGLAFCFHDWTRMGQFGDLFGSVNALFSGLAFAGLICTIFLQRQELSLQRDELRLQREEMVASRAELARQAQVAIGQIKVAEKQARIERIKLQSEDRIPGARREFIVAIDTIADEIEKIAVLLEADSKDS